MNRDEFIAGTRIPGTRIRVRTRAYGSRSGRRPIISSVPSIPVVKKGPPSLSPGWEEPAPNSPAISAIASTQSVNVANGPKTHSNNALVQTWPEANRLAVSKPVVKVFTQERLI